MGMIFEGGQKTIYFDVTEGDRYQVIGGGTRDGDDIDICVYDGRGSFGGSLVGCDTLMDSPPIVEFVAETSGTYNAVVRAPFVSSEEVFLRIMLIEVP